VVGVLLFQLKVVIEDLGIMRGRNRVGGLLLRLMFLLSTLISLAANRAGGPGSSINLSSGTVGVTAEGCGISIGTFMLPDEEAS